MQTTEPIPVARPDHELPGPDGREGPGPIPTNVGAGFFPELAEAIVEAGRRLPDPPPSPDAGRPGPRRPYHFD